jgi:hypothetical protein
MDPLGDKDGHTPTVSTTITDPIYQPPPESDSEGDREIFMVGEGEQPTEKTTRENAHEAKEEIARAAQLAKEANRVKRHNNLQDDSGSFEDEPRDGAP